MTNVRLLLITGLGALVVLGDPAWMLAQDAKPEVETWLTDWKPYDSEELKTLAGKSSRKASENRRLMELILQAIAKQDDGFRHLLKRKDLREANNVDLALSAYDFTLNASEPALNRILAQLATEDIGADVDTTLVLAFIDEWDRSLRAFRKHFFRTDGAGGSNQSFFLRARANLYPEKYEEVRAVLEAPVDWTSPLLPRKD